MNYIEKLLKKRFDNAPSEEGIDADALWAEISPLLPPATTPSKASRINPLWLLLLLFITGTGTYFYFSQTQEAQNQDVIVKNAIAASSPTSKSSTSSSLASAATKETQAEPDSPLVTPAPTITKAPSKYEKSTPVKESTIPILASSTITPINATSAITLDKPVENTSQTPDYQTEEANATNISRSITTAGVYDKRVINTLPLPFTFLMAKIEELTTPLVKPAANILTTRSARPIQLGFFSGINAWKNTFPKVSAITEQVTQANEYSLGSTFSAELLLQLRPNVGLVSGIAYTRTHHQFNFVQNWDTLMYRNNVPGSDLINALATRTVKHYNNFHFLSIPILVSGSKSFGKVAIGVNAGITFNYTTTQNGKTLNSNEEIVSYADNESTTLPFSDFFLSYQLRPFVNYQLSDKIGLQLRPELSYQQLGQSDVYTTQQRALLTGLSLGVLYSR